MLALSKESRLMPVCNMSPMASLPLLAALMIVAQLVEGTDSSELLLDLTVAMAAFTFASMSLIVVCDSLGFAWI